MASAARVNWKKNEALAVGEWPGGLPQNLQWKREGMKYLGVFLGTSEIWLRSGVERCGQQYP